MIEISFDAAAFERAFFKAMTAGVRNCGRSAPEPNRPRLTWADASPFDAFKGFTVTSDCASEPLARGLHSPDLRGGALVVYPHLVTPQHGTAHKLG